MNLDTHTPIGAALALLPELVLTAWSLVVLLVVAWRHTTERDSQLAGWLSFVGVALSGVALWWLWSHDARSDGVPHMIALDEFRYASAALILGITGATTLLSIRYLTRQRLLAPEYHCLVLFAAVGMLLMAAASDLIMVFLGLEVMSVSVYVLAGFDRFRRSSAEAALKYFLIGAFASGFLLYGIALIWGATGQTNLTLIAAQLTGAPTTLLLRLGLGMLLIGFAFKVSAVPFHMWAPDVYDGSPTPITGFMATGVKAAAFVALVRVLNEGFPSAKELWQPIIGALAVATILFGNIVALAQDSLKRMLAYSSVAHAGYILVAVWAGTPFGSGAVLFYLASYCMATIGSFGMVAAVEHVGSRTVLIDDLEGLFEKRPWGSLSLAICLLSLLGFPATFGFVGKWYLIASALREGHWILPVATVIGSAISAGYYLPVVTAMTFKPERSVDAHRQVAFSRASKAIVAAVVGATILFGIWPTPVLDGALASARSLTNLVSGMAER
ncbi:MAG: NADH-quinone oxidoreductase subunit N [Gemmatimonadales bacterium]|nr:NADH-quinone oxidoreductase subunit N [Gemmatimonadales bacterium]